MIGIVLVTHGRLAQEFISAMEHMVGPQSHLRAVCIGPEDDIERRQREIAAAVKAVDLGDGVVIATDMFGGTPCNLSMSMLGRHDIELERLGHGYAFSISLARAMTSSMPPCM